MFHVRIYLFIYIYICMYILGCVRKGLRDFFKFLSDQMRPKYLHTISRHRRPKIWVRIFP
jgi:hypothetical protein